MRMNIRTSGSEFPKVTTDIKKINEMNTLNEGQLGTVPPHPRVPVAGTQSLGPVKRDRVQNKKQRYGP